MLWCPRLQDAEDSKHTRKRSTRPSRTEDLTMTGVLEELDSDAPRRWGRMAQESRVPPTQLNRDRPPRTTTTKRRPWMDEDRSSRSSNKTVAAVAQVLECSEKRVYVLLPCILPRPSHLIRAVAPMRCPRPWTTTTHQDQTLETSRWRWAWWTATAMRMTRS